MGAVLAAFLTVSAAAEAACPADGRQEALREDPARLLGCEAAPDAISRAWGAHALRALGRSEDAARAYGSLSEPLPDLAPVVRLLVARSLLEAGHAPAEAVARLGTEEPPRRWLRAEYQALAAEAALLAGDDEATTRAREAAKLGAPGDAMTLVELRTALRRGDADAVRKSLTLLRTEFPDTGPAAEAERLAGERERLSSVEPADLGRRWARWSGRGGAASVAAECLPMLPSVRGKPPDVARARLECGKALSTMRHAEAERVLRQAAQEKSVRAAALLATARVLARANAAPPVVAVCTALAATKSRDEMAECDFLAAVLRLNHGERDAGRAALDAVASRYKNHPRAADATWFLALDDLKDAPERANARFDALVRSARDAQEKAQALYWRARTRPAEQAAEARADWREAAILDPYGYYGWLGAARAATVGGEAPGTSPPGGSPPPSPAPSAAPPSPAPAPLPSSPANTAPQDGGGGSVTTNAPLPRLGGAPPPTAKLASLLLSTGFLRYAALELAEAVSPGRPDALSWVPFLAQAGQFDTVLRIGQAQGGPGQPWPPPPEKRAAVEAAFPPAFPDAFVNLPKGVDRYFMLSLMRRESRYDPDATSAAQARGLLQLLPKTAAQLAKELGEPAPPDEHLHDPALNVHLASHYVARLQERFPHPFLTAAAYNAGPNAVARWTADNAGMDIDEWVERIPFRETRAYVKAVAAAYGAYGLLYAGARPPLALGRVAAAGTGVDY